MRIANCSVTANVLGSSTDEAEGKDADDSTA